MSGKLYVGSMGFETGVGDLGVYDRYQASSADDVPAD